MPSTRKMKISTTTLLFPALFMINGCSDVRSRIAIEAAKRLVCVESPSFSLFEFIDVSVIDMEAAERVDYYLLKVTSKEG